MHLYARATMLLAILCALNACLVAASDTLDGAAPLPLVQLAAADGASSSDDLKMVALEALMTAPPERALPSLRKVLAGNHSDAIKAKALFVLGQIDEPVAHDILLGIARDGSSPLQYKAIRMIGIGGSQATVAGLKDIYAGGNDKVRKSVLQAYLIAGESESVYEIAVNAGSDDEFDRAVKQLGVMGASDALRRLRERGVSSESLIHAYAISGDIESLDALARDNSNPQMQSRAVRSIGIVGGHEAHVLLRQIYRDATDEEIRAAALNGMLIADDDEGILALFRASTDDVEKRKLLRKLVVMDSKAALDLIDETLEADQ